MAVTKQNLVRELYKLYYKDFDSSSSDSAYSLKKKCDQLAGIAHVALYTLEENNMLDFVILKHDDIRDWWTERKQEVRRQQEAAEAKQRRAELRERALSRLTDEEKEALGLKKK